MSYEFSLRRRILFGDCDPAGVIYTPRISDFVVEATHDFLAARLGGPAVRTMMAMGILPPARALNVEFLNLLSWDEQIDITVAVAELGQSSIHLAVEALNAQGQPAFRARMTYVCISPKTRRPVAIPKPLRVALAF